MCEIKTKIEAYKTSFDKSVKTINKYPICEIVEYAIKSFNLFVKPA